MSIPRRLSAALCAPLLAVALASLPACKSQEPEPAPKPLVVVSVLPQAFAVERIGSGLVRIEVMIPPGASPAVYEPTIEKLGAIERASAYVKVGHPAFPFEAAWLDRLLRGRNDLTVVDTTGDAVTDDHDPHVWLAPVQMRAMARSIHAALVDILPLEHKQTLDENLEIFLAEIDTVETFCRRTLEPARGNRFFVFHPAWGYFASAYGLEQVAIESHGKEPDAHSLSRLIAEARESAVKVIFVQPQMNHAGADLVAEEIGARVERLDPLAYEWSDNLKAAARLLADGSVPSPASAGEPPEAANNMPTADPLTAPPAP